MKRIWMLALLWACNSGSGGDVDAGADGAVDGGPVDGGAVDGGATCDCPESDDPCSEIRCEDGECVVVPSDAICDDGYHCTVDRCVAGPVCPDGSAPVDGACFSALKTDDLLGWADARAACQAQGGDFPILRDAAANERARKAADTLCGTGAVAFLGLTDAETEGRFVWPDGSEAEFARWSADQPAAEADDQDFVVLLADSTWAVTADAVGCFVCTAEVEPYTCLHTPGDAETLARAETCNGEDDDCDGQVDEGDSAVLCDDGNACSEDLCLGASGCEHTDASAVRCDDGIACTLDTCDPTAGCAHVTDDSACDDGIECTQDRCDAAMGCVETPDDAACDDGQGCTTDRCDPSKGCEYAADDAACDDGVGCTLDTCTAFEGCGHAPRNVVCDDGNPCTDDVCDPQADCVNDNNAVACEDADPCTTASQCSDGACAGTEFLHCDDELPCTADRCEPGVGCVAPFVGECDHPGPVGGFFQGPFTLTGVPVQLPLGLGEFRWGCTGVLAVVVDASRQVDVYGVGQLTCATDLDGLLRLLEDDVVHPTRVRGRIDDLNIPGEFDVGRSTAPFNLDIELDAMGVPTGLSGVAEGTMPLGDVPFPLSGVVEDIAARFGNLQLAYDLTIDLDRVLIDGDCCTPAGCAPSTDQACYARGGSFAASDAGTCCGPDGCAPRTLVECATAAGSFVPARQSACCLADGCMEISDALCTARGGAPTIGLTCADQNGDTLPDVCGAPANFGYDAPTNCELEGQRLTVRVNDAFDLVLESAWRADGDGFDAGPTVGIVTPLGPITLPAVGMLHVGCGDRFSLLGSIDAPPGMGNVSAWPSTAIEPGAAGAAFGFAYGYEFAEQGIELEGPFADGRPYLYAHANTGVSVGLGEGIEVEAVGGSEFTLGIDPLDPAFIVEVGGDLLDQAAAGLVSKVGFGLSRGGNLTWRSAVDLHDGTTFGPLVASGHIWRSGEFALIPIPNLPVNIDLEGELLVDVGAAVGVLESAARAIVSADLDALRAVARDVGANAEDLVSQMSFSANVNALSISAGPLSFQIGRGAMHINDERFTFAGEGFSFGELLARNALFEPLSAITVRQAGRVWGYLDPDSFHFEFEGDFAAGPFVLEGARVIVDSRTGVEIKNGEFGMDFGAFLDQLLSIMDCEFDREGASCSVGGIEIAHFMGYVDQRGFALSAGMAVPFLAEVQFAARVAPDGAFSLTGFSDVGLAGFQTQRISVTITDQYFAVGTVWAQFTQRIALAGRIGYGDGTYSLTGSGAITVLGFTLSGIDVHLSNRTGLRATGTLQTPLAGQRLRAELVVNPGANDWRMTGTGEFAILGHRLAGLRAEARANNAGAGLTLTGDVNIAGATAELNGYVRSNGEFSLTGSAALRIARFTLASAALTLNRDGLAVRAMLDLLGAQIALVGEVESNGDFRFATDGPVNVRLFGLSATIDVALTKVGGRIEARGNVGISFAGLRFNGSFLVNGDGQLSLTAGTSVRVNWWRVRGSGSCSFSMNNAGFSARFSGRLCVSVPLADDPCVSTGGSINSNGTVCVNLPVVGRRCVGL